MALRLRQFNAILNDAINYMAANTSVTDFNKGSIIRTLLEATSLEDEEQYFQIAQLLKLFSVRNTKGEDLERRAQDYNIEGKLSPSPAVVYVTIRDNSIIHTTLGSSIDSGDSKLKVTSLVAFSDLINEFNQLVNPILIRVGEGTSNVEDIIVQAIDTDTKEFITYLTEISVGDLLHNNHQVGELVSLVSDNTNILPPDKVVSVGARVQRPATGTNAAVDYIMQESAVIPAGNFESNDVRCVAVVPGYSGRVGKGLITSFTDGPPFDGASVINKFQSSGGTGEEIDTQFQDRIVRSQQIKTAATFNSIMANLSGFVEAESGQQITTVKVREDFINDIVRVYIDDGTGLAPDKNIYAVGYLASNVGAGEGTLLLDSSISDFPDKGFVYVQGTTSGIFKYSEKSGMALVLDTEWHPNGVGTLSFSEDAIVRYVELAVDQTELGQTYVWSKLLPIQDNTLKVYRAVFDDVNNIYTNAVELTEFTATLGTGQIQLHNPLTQGFSIFLHYTSFEGIVRSAQLVLNGVEDDLITYPGVKAAGIRTVVETPTIINITMRASIKPKPLFNESDLRPLVTNALVQYINSLTVGQDAIIAEMIKVSQAIDGVLDTTILEPTTNIVAAEDELIRVSIDDTVVT